MTSASLPREADVVIVGGGPAGLATAIYLCHADLEMRGRVVVVEKERYPRDKFCAGGIGARADAALAKIGVIVDVPSVAIDGISLALPGGTLCVRERAIGRVIRRVEYDHALARIARERGVEIVEGAKATAIRVDARSVEIETTVGALRGRVLVGADGVGSLVRRSLGLPAGALRAQVVELDTEEVPGDPARDLLHFDAADAKLTGYAWDFPTLIDGKPLMCRGVYHLRLGDDDIDVHAVLADRLAARGLDIARYKLKRYAERGFELHRPYASPRVMLVGEAAGIDGLTGEGIAQAIGYGAFAGPYLAEKLASDDLRFADFASRLGRSTVGVELGVRTRVLRHYFGARRDLIDRFLLGTPQFLRVGIQHFAGRRL
ncbi:MAG TPA: NAD(P)/FAD-dependent oxidoreductase, partial [Polyangiaceae bacterium]|nr:NAD(P)/FAD-dependent oxidoreductase [Polyangiaceae bacterium]